jgi:deoxyribonuclease V
MEDPNVELLALWDEEVVEMKKRQILVDDYNKNVTHIAGVDISFVPGDPQAACAGLVVMTYPDMRLVYEDFQHVQLNVPYIPGYLAFREVQHLVELLQKLKRDRPDLYPQLVFVDGNGTHHPKRFGLACHLGVLLDIPTIGVGKTFLVVGDLHFSKVKKEFLKSCQTKGRLLYLFVDHVIQGEAEHLQEHLVEHNDDGCFGAAVATADNLRKPIFVSSGHRMSLSSAITWTLKCCRFRQPEPIRYADQMSRQFIKLHE